MCFILALFQVHPRYPLIVAANRDEARSRPSTGPIKWPGDPEVWAGRDDVAGGTWLGVNSAGVLAAITNRVGGKPDPNLPSRGQLCLAVLRQPSLQAARATVEADLSARGYNPFNLLIATVNEAWTADLRGRNRRLTPGVHIITNHGDPDDAADAAVPRAIDAVGTLEIESLELAAILGSLGEICKDTREPNPICRPDGERGTVSSSLIALDEDGAVAAYWHADGPPTIHHYQQLEVLASRA